MDTQLGKLVVKLASKNRTDREAKVDTAKVDTALLLTSGQAVLLTEKNDAAAILKELGLNSSPTVVINLIGDATRQCDLVPQEVFELLVHFMKQVVPLQNFTFFFACAMCFHFQIFLYFLLLSRSHESDTLYGFYIGCDTIRKAKPCISFVRCRKEFAFEHLFSPCTGKVNLTWNKFSRLTRIDVHAYMFA